MSENFGYSHANRPGQAKVGTVGMANPGVEHRIGEGGEVQVRSPGQMLGYYKNEEKTREDLTDDGFLKTGDMGEIDRDGCLRITGRVKDLFKTSKGKYVVPVPIENRFNHPKAEVVCVAGANQPQPCLMVLLSEEARDELERRVDQKTRDLSIMLEQLKTSNEQLEHATLTDALTGVGNRRYLDTRFPELIKQCQQTRSCLGVLVIDADHFKKINDEFRDNIYTKLLKPTKHRNDLPGA